MEEAEHSRYVSQLKAEFDSCDTTATGFLDREELTALCGKLQLDAHRPLLLDTLLRERAYARVNFEEFKEGFVSVLSRSLDFSTSEEDSSYLQPVVTDEVKPKFVKGTKRYGRRSRPDSKADPALTCDSEDSPASRTEATDSSPAGVRRAKLRRSTSLESVESLKSDEDAGSQKDAQTHFQSEGPRQEEVELGVVVGGGGGVLTAVCDHLDLQQLNTEELDLLLRRLDPDVDGRVSIRDFHKVLRGSAPISCSTPVRSADLQRTSHRSQAVSEERSARSTLPSLLTATVGQRVLSRLDDGLGCSCPERVIALWTEEGIRNSRDILQTLDFSLEERLSLADLTLALDNELLVSGNGIHQAALISYKNEIQHLQMVAEQACRERDKVRADLDQADQRNLQLVREVDDRHASMETLNQSRIRELEQDFRERVACLRSQTEQESEALLQQTERERGVLQEELQLLRVQEARLQEELCSAAQESRRLEDELTAMRLKLCDAEGSAVRLQRDLDLLLQDKFGGDPAVSGLSPEERFSEVVKDYELQCRRIKELRDRNDELSSELELLKSQRSDRKSRRSAGDAAAALSWTEQQRCISAESDCDESDMKRSSSPLIRRKLQPADKTALGSLDGVSGPAVSIQTELALEQVEQKHQEELQQLRIQLDTQVNFYERSLERMRRSMEVERKDISQAFKLEISELEEQKEQAEQQLKKIREGGAGWSNEQERRMQREQAELEQNFAREISNLVQRLSAEKDQLEAELKLKMDQEVMLVREEAQQQLSHLKLQHAEDQHRLLLHQLQEQRGVWENRIAQLKQEKLQCEERAGEQEAQISSERRRLEELHKEEVSRLQEEVQNAHRLFSQSEEFRERCSRLEEDLEASGRRCSELEARLEEACMQLEGSISFLEAQEVLNTRLATQRSCMEQELQEAKTKEEQLLVQVSQLREELGSIQAASSSLLQAREEVADDYVQQEAQLRAREQTVNALRTELETVQEAMRSKAEGLAKLIPELDLLKTDRDRLIQDLKDQAMAVDTLQLELDGVSEELDRRRSTEEALQKALKQEQTRTLELQAGLVEEKEEVCRLNQENGSYARLADQLSTQIVEMEEEISTLRDHLREVSSQLNETADLVLDLRRQLNTKTSEVDRLRAEVADGAGVLRRVEASVEKHHRANQQLRNQLEARDRDLDQGRLQVLQLHRDLQDSQNQLSTSKELFEEEKRTMMQQLMDLETLVLALEEVMDPASPHRTQLDAARSENAALQERLSDLQQEVQDLEDQAATKRRRLEEEERQRERSRQEEERLHKENSSYREEVLDLSRRNLQLSADVAELSARLHGDQEAVRMLQERLATVSKEQEEAGASVRRLQDAALQQEREKLRLQAAWTQERRLLEQELAVCREKVGRVTQLEAELSSAALKLQWTEEDKRKVERDDEERRDEVEALQRLLLSVEAEAALLRSQLHGVSQEKLGHAQEVTDLQRKLQEAQNKLDELESSVRRLLTDNEELHQALEEQEEQTSITLQEETHKLRVHNQELQHKLAELQVQSLEVHKLTQEQQNLKTKLSELETARTQAQDQAVRADTALSLVQAQHVRRMQEVQERAGSGCREQAELLQEEQRRSQQLEEALGLQAQQSSSHISMKQDQYERTVSGLQHRADQLETKLRGVRAVLQEKVQLLKEQLAKNSQSAARLKDLYVENSQLMKALQVTERRQKKAEKKNFQLEEKVGALHALLREVVHVSLAT